jgi:hypothetical protein
MTVKEAQKKIENQERAIKDMQKFLILSEEEQEEIAEKLGLCTPIKQLVCISVNSMCSENNLIRKKIENATIEH